MTEDEYADRCAIWSYFAWKHGYFNCDLRTDSRITRAYEYRTNHAHNFCIEAMERAFKNEGKQ